MEGDRAQIVASGFLTLLASQIVTRLITFTINLLIARHLTPDAYGLASVQFHLLTTTALFISREGFRRGCLRFGARVGVSAADECGSSSSKSSKSRKCGGSSSSRGGGDGGGGVDDRRVLRVAALTVPFGLVVTAGVCGIALWRHTAAANAAGAAALGSGTVRDPEVPYYREAVLLHGVAAVLELLGEPFYILASVHLMFRARVAVEFCSTLVKSVVTLGLLAASHRRSFDTAAAVSDAIPLPPAVTFSLAQLALAAVAAAGYWAVGWWLLAARTPPLPPPAAPAAAPAAAVSDDRGHEGQEGGNASRGRDDGRPGTSRLGFDGGWLAPWTPMERHVLATSAVFTLQAVEKLALAEGSKVVLATMQSAVNQGVYGLVSNLGSLVVRTLFQPLEEAAFAAFSTWGADAKAVEAATAATAAAAAVPAEAQPLAAAARLAPLARALSPMVKVVVVLGLLAAAFGPSYSYVLLRLVYGMRWSETEAPTVLAAYCVYVLLLAMNGIGEAFVHAVLDARGLQQSNALLLVFSGAHLAVCVALVRQYGALGLVAADGANMLLRIAYSTWCIRRFFRPLPTFSLRRDLLPAPTTLAAFAAAAAAAAVSNHLLLRQPAAAAATVASGVLQQRAFLRRAAAHVGVGVVLLAVLLGLLARTERAALRQVLEMRRRRRPGGGGGDADGGDCDGGGAGSADAGRGTKEE